MSACVVSGLHALFQARAHAHATADRFRTLRPYGPSTPTRMSPNSPNSKSVPDQVFDIASWLEDMKSGMTEMDVASLPLQLQAPVEF